MAARPSNHRHLKRGAMEFKQILSQACPYLLASAAKTLDGAQSFYHSDPEWQAWTVWTKFDQSAA